MTTGIGQWWAPFRTCLCCCSQKAYQFHNGNQEEVTRGPKNQAEIMTDESLNSEMFKEVRAVLSDDWREKLSEVDHRRTVEKICEEYGVEVHLSQGKFSSVTSSGSLHSLYRVMNKLQSAFSAKSNENELNNSEVNGGEKLVDQKEKARSAESNMDAVVMPNSNEINEGLNKRSKRHDGPSAKECSQDENARYRDELDIEEHMWHYMLYQNANIIGDFANKHGGGLQLTRVYERNGHAKCKIVVTSKSESQLHDACEELAALYRAMAEGNIQKKKVWLTPKDYHDFLSAELQKVHVLLEASPSYIIGSPADVEKAQSVIQLSQKQWQKEKMKEPFASTETSAEDLFTFATPSGITVHVRQGNLVHQQTEAIVNPANVNLSHGSGAAGAIADAAGPELQRECKEYIKKYRKLKTSEPMHTKAGNLPSPILYVIHVAGPNSSEYPGKKEICHEHLKNTFRNSFHYANKELKVHSVAMPAISSGIFGVKKRMSAQKAYEGLMEFDGQVAADKTRSLQHVHFVNIDKETTEAMANVMKGLYDSKHLFPQIRPDMIRQMSAPVRGTELVTERPTQHYDAAQNNLVFAKGQAWINVEVSGDENAVKSVFPKLSESDKVKIFITIGPKDGSNDTTDNISQMSDPSKSIPHLGLPVSSSADELSKRDKEEHDVDQRRAVNGIEGTSVDESFKEDDSARSQNMEAAGGDPIESKGKNPNVEDTGAKPKSKRGLKKENCVICMEAMEKVKELDCGHKFCEDCIAEYFEKGQPKCPSCGKLFGVLKGNQPAGSFSVRELKYMHLAGYEKHGAIEITYEFPDGTQTEEHPNPGERYKGTRRTAYLPDNPDGQKVLELLRRAFDARLLFTIGTSVTTGKENVVVWNDIHHKTKPDGPHGYPDATYLERVKSELEAKGIVPERKKKKVPTATLR